MYKCFLFVLLLLSTLQAGAQSCNYTLSGTVKDFHNGENLELVVVYITPLQKSVSTDAEGKFAIKDLCPGTYDLIVSHISCENKTIKVSLTEDKDIMIKLEHYVEELSNVNVEANLSDTSSETASIERVATETIEKYSGATLGDALATVEGVNILKTGNSITKPIIHGLFGSRVAIVNNGLRQQDQEWGVEHAPNIDLNNADDIHVVKGASALRYGGDAIGGTIVINPRRVLSKDTLMGKAILTAQSNGRGGTATASFNNFNESGWYQQGTITAKRLGDFESPDYVLSNTGSETYAANFTAGFKKFEYGIEANYSYYRAGIGILRSAHIGNSADLVRSINSGEPFVIRDFTYDIEAPKQEVDHHAIQLKAFKRFSDLGKLSLDYGLQFNNRLEFDIRRGERRDLPSLDMDLLTHNLAAYLAIDKYDDLTLEVGLDGMYQINTPDARTGVRRLIPDYNSFRIGSFTAAKWDFSKKWLFEAGVRYDYFDINAQKFYFTSRWEELGYDQQFPQFEVRQSTNQIYTEPEFDYNLLAFTVGSRYEMDDHQSLSFNLSTANRAPNPSELFSDGLHHALATIELGRLDLEKEASYKFNSNYQLNQNGFKLGISPHLNLIQNYIQLEPRGVEFTTRGSFPVEKYRQSDALVAGIDVTASYQFDKIRSNNSEQSITGVQPAALLSSSFSYIYGQDRDLDRPLIDMPPAQFQLGLTLYDAFLNDLDFEVGMNHVWEQKRIPDTDFMTDVIRDDGSIETVEVNVSQPPEAYTLLNAGVSYAFAKARLSLSVQNLLNTNYRNYLNQLRYYAEDVGRNVQLQFIYKI
ncbi:TonB-dependent receptor [Nonlabens spongiae]|uniref:TonB-dependent receptor n=1 Tax=Nonlabens spongiae TaxID=331648 RepID=A0A1W6MGI8_9FLAO|nr:TonB-dependent receptor [Nonlabens spongiae]ARN76723.1 TonB-dependent receptor [Nonlabens spongiae]